MKFGTTAVAWAAIGTVAQAGVIGKRQSENAGYVKINFDKVHGRTLESATKEKTVNALIVKRDDGYEELELTNRNTFYTAELEIGTPKQNINVVVDTGSSDLWVLGKGTSCASDDEYEDDEEAANVTTDEATETATDSSSASSTFGCSDFGSFDTSQSSSYKKNSSSFVVKYGDGTYATGPWGIDSVTIGNLTLPNATIGVANYTNGTVGGILGVGLMVGESTYSGTSSYDDSETYQYENVPAMMASSGLINKNAYSLFLNSMDADTGSVLFGAVDHSKYSGTLSTVPILKFQVDDTEKTAIGFFVTMQGIGVTDGTISRTVTTTSFPVLLDSGTTLMYVPYTLSDLMADQVGAEYSSSLGYYLMDCPDDDDPSQFVFDFGGAQIKTNLTNYILQDETSSGVCVLGIIPTTEGYAILGDVFLKDTYVVYDLEDLEVSVAQANFDGGDEDIEVITSEIPSAVRAAGYSSTWSTASPITSGGNIFTLSGSSAIKTHSSSDDGILSKATKTTLSGASANDISSGTVDPQIGTSLHVSSKASTTRAASTGATSSAAASNTASATATISSTSGTATKANVGDRIVPASFLFMISSFFFSFLL